MQQFVFVLMLIVMVNRRRLVLLAINKGSLLNTEMDEAENLARLKYGFLL